MLAPRSSLPVLDLRLTERLARHLRAYFYSGWAFFIPYLLIYLLYASQKWPANPVAAGLSLSTEHWSTVPSLLHVYWGLHALHLVLAAIAFRSWWNGASHRPSIPNAVVSAINSLPATRYSLLRPLLPWALLALVFYIPGVYLEWPSDPWEHLRRINEWHARDIITAHSTWTKSTYFLPYSLTGHTTGVGQLSWLNVYYTAICLLLCWQYCRLARAVGLGEHASFIFVLINALTFGNNIFTFYRYYGLSSSILAQLGAIALIRIAVKTARDPSGQGNERRYVHRIALLLASCVLLLTLIGFNHVQGLGITALGVLAVVFWKLCEWKRSMIGWLALIAVLSSIAIVRWFPRHAALDEVYRPQGWLNAWYGFNLLSSGSPPLIRSFQILGAFGTLNLAIGVWTAVRKNHVAGWLTFMPVLGLILPCFALPIAHILASRNGGADIITFHRFLFAVPAGLALVVGLSSICSGCMPALPSTLVHPQPLPWRYAPLTALLLPATLFVALVLVPIQAGYNRFWHSLQIPPDDLQLKPLLALWNSTHLSLAESQETQTFTFPLVARVRETFSPHARWDIYRQTNARLNAVDLEHELDELGSLPATERSLAGDPLPDLVIRSVPSQASRDMRLVANPTVKGSRWIAVGGDNFESTTTSANKVVISNKTGHSTHVFNADLIAVARNKRYQLTSTLRQSGASTGTNYLAVAWYDKVGNFLVSAHPSPEGADSPAGWSNGTYSYYGLNNDPAPSHWSTYSISFGWGEFAAIPVNAAYLRMGALLNNNAAAAAKIEMGDVTLRQKPDYSQLLFALPNPLDLFSTGSFAARLSGHWSPQRVAEDHAGLTELRAVAAGKR